MQKANSCRFLFVYFFATRVSRKLTSVLSCKYKTMEEVRKTRFSVGDLLAKPLFATQLIGKKVLVEVRSRIEKSVCGYFQAMDPVFGHVSIVNFDDIETDHPSLTSHRIIMADFVKNILTVDAEPVRFDLVDKVFKRSIELVNKEELKLRKESIVKLIGDNKLPVSHCEDGSLIIASIVTLKPPYGLEDLVCTNDIILARVKSILFKS